MLDNEIDVKTEIQGDGARSLQSRVQTAIDEGAGCGEGRLTGGVVLLVESKDDLVTNIGELKRAGEQGGKDEDEGGRRLTTASGV